MQYSRLGCSMAKIGNNLVRQFHRSNCLRMNPKNVEEIKIPVPWGHIAGEWWGSKDKEPIFALHGWQDNARTWEPLMCLLPDDVAVLAIDMPGNGLSSHYPPFNSYNFIDAVYVLRRIQKYYNLKDIVILGHSGGSASGFLYASIYPESVRGYFGVDFLIYAYLSEAVKMDRMIKTFDRKIELNLRDHEMSPTYDWEVARENFIKATKGSVNSKTAEIIMKRGMIKKPDGKYTYTRDSRQKSPALESISLKQAEALASNITSHVRLIKASNSRFFDSGIKHFPQILDIIKSKAKSYELHQLEGNHHVHMDTPELILPLFLDMLKLV